MSQLNWKLAAQVDIPDENCPDCNEPLSVEGGQIACPNCHQQFGDAMFNPNEHDWANVGQQAKKPSQPLYKWSYDGHQLTIWPVDEYAGRPHHIEVTGLDFYKLAQGRVYDDAEGNLEILVWEDRGTPEMQDEAIEAVDSYLKNKLGKGAEYYSFQGEGGVYQNQQPGKENWDDILTSYFQTPVKATKPTIMDRLRGREVSPIKGLL